MQIIKKEEVFIENNPNENDGTFSEMREGNGSDKEKTEQIVEENRDSFVSNEIENEEIEQQ